jgi:DNA-binding transcriptional regulator LsrR (DeoR family)
MAEYSDDLVVTVANLYYLEDLTQEEVASKLGISRVAVTRILKRARDAGHVQISVRRPLPELFDMGLRLEKAWGLRVARVVPEGPSDEETCANLGRAGAELLGYYAGPGKRVGAAWSRTVSAIVPFVKRPARPPLSINELAGTYLEPGMPYGVSWRLAEKLGAHLETIPSPVLVGSAQAKKLMLQEKSVVRAFEDAAKVDVAIVGIGNTTGEASLVKAGYLTARQLAEIRAKGAVGDILMRYFDAQGRHVPLSFDDRAVTLEWDSIRRLPLIIALAFGGPKLEAIEGALAGGLIHGLVTDRRTALALLEAAQRPGRRPSPANAAEGPAGQAPIA